MKGNKRSLYVGIDIHVREHKAVVIPIALLEQPGTAWKRVKTLSVKNDINDFQRLDMIIKSHISSVEQVAVAVDHTGGHYSEPLVYYLQARGYDVYYLETRAVKAARERFLDEENKSDVIDCTSTAYMLYLRDVHGLSFRISATTFELGSRASVINTLVLQRYQFNKLATQATNRLHQLLLAVFPEGESKCFGQLMKVVPYYPIPKDILESNGLGRVENLPQKHKENIIEFAASTVGVPGDIYKWLITDLSTQRTEAQAKRATLTSILHKQVETHPYGNVLLSFPHIGDIIAATIIGIIKDIERWPDKKRFKKALGLYASFTQSGPSSGRTRRGKEGSKRGRRVLFQACFGCVRRGAPENDFRDYYYRQVVQGKPRMKALVSTMGKLAEIIYHCLKAGEPYQYQGIYR